MKIQLVPNKAYNWKKCTESHAHSESSGEQVFSLYAFREAQCTLEKKG